MEGTGWLEQNTNGKASGRSEMGHAQQVLRFAASHAVVSLSLRGTSTNQSMGHISLSRLKRVDVPSAQLSEEFLAQRLESAAHLAPAMGLGWQVEYDRGGQDGIRIG